MVFLQTRGENLRWDIPWDIPWDVPWDIPWDVPWFPPYLSHLEGRARLSSRVEKVVTAFRGLKTSVRINCLMCVWTAPARSDCMCTLSEKSPKM